MMTLEEDLIERYEGNSTLHNERANNVKDGIRERAILELCNLIE
jgi:hypothetical protein